MTSRQLREALGWLWGPGRRRQWRRTVLRRGLAMACATVATLGVLAVARAPRGGPDVSVLVATRTLGAGAVLTPGTVRVARWPAGLAPEGAFTSTAAVIGRRLASPVGVGEALTDARVSGAGVLQGQPAGTVAVHVPLADAAATGMVSPGDTVDLVGPQGAVARAVRVLAVDSAPSAAGGLMGSGGVTDGSTGIVVGVDESEAALLARAPADAMGQPTLMLVLRSA